MQIWTDIRHRDAGISPGEVERLASRILKELGLPEAELSLVLVDDEEMARLNLRYLRRTGPTNVIAFPMREGEGGHVAPNLLGDVVISLDTARREAGEAGIPWRERLAALLVHGILHLLGHDHEQGEGEAERMEAEEKRLTALLKGRD
jgi:probable rRNA maturation factor